MAGIGQSVAQGTDNQTTNNSGVAKPYLSFHRMDVYIHQRRRYFQKQGHHGVTFPCQ
jgi:hypothetical protein